MEFFADDQKMCLLPNKKTHITFRIGIENSFVSNIFSIIRRPVLPPPHAKPIRLKLPIMQLESDQKNNKPRKCKLRIGILALNARCRRWYLNYYNIHNNIFVALSRFSCNSRLIFPAFYTFFLCLYCAYSVYVRVICRFFFLISFCVWSS